MPSDPSFLTNVLLLFLGRRFKLSSEEVRIVAIQQGHTKELRSNREGTPIDKYLRLV